MPDSNSSLDKVADEIWLLIFLASVEDYDPSPPQLSHSSNPFILSAVCQDWRRIALANTVLWDTISFWFGDIYNEEDDSDEAVELEKRFQAKIDALKLWIGRAGTRPLSIKVRNLDDDFCAEAELAKELPKIIIDHAARIVSLDWWIYFDWFPLLTGVEFPRLQTLKLFAPDIQDLDSFYEGIISDVPLDFSRCSNLSAVDVHGSFDKGLGITLPWNQIADATLSYLLPKDCIKVLDILPNLQRLSLTQLAWDDEEDDGNDGEAEWTAKRRNLGRGLTSLKLDFMTPTVIRQILNSLPLTLEDLDLGRLYRHWNFTHTYQLPLEVIPPFAHTLRSLKLELTNEDTAPLINVFSQLPGLEKLELNTHDKWQGQDSRFFLGCFGTARILPSLLSLKLTGSGGMSHLDDETIMKMLAYRWVGSGDCAKIRNVHLVFSRGIGFRRSALNAAVRGELKGMIEGGLNVIIESKGPQETLSLIWDEYSVD